ncbi:HAMP domain-containing histidine kinase [Ligilactobacillus sp. WILCCON 0076]|uniref:Signal transduction histidine-protein kinase ArlS n=1 Tax=Ligilactobacillus ubinensis TaxID=2876789 RepID=A0A9X2JLU3_9LACO|nr:HAMP domain-containing histidine kinase [Ligilactobacillus ubinensis]MCP0886441.1 HAMP domain-containing histidine kinase [Ligilactobacillus ubinensis]
MKKFGKKKEHHFLSLKMKWSIGTGIGVLLIFLVFSVLLYQSFSSLLLRQEQQYAVDALSTASGKLATNDSELTIKDVKEDLSSSLQQVKTTGKTSALYTDSVFVTLSRKNIGVSVYNLSGDEIFASRKVPVKFDTSNSTSDHLTSVNGTTVFVTSKAVKSKSTNQIIGYIQVTNRLTDYDNTKRKLILIFIVFGLTAALASTMLGYGLSSWLLRPVDLLNDTIGKINEDDKEGDALATVRVPVLKQHDELSELSLLFNDMLDRMQRYIEQQQQFVEDVSHELRTPVAIIQGHLDLLNRWGKDDPEVLAESIAASLQEIKRMKSLVQEMLDLSRAEQVEIQFGQEKTDAREVGLQVFNNFQMIHPEFSFVLDNDLKHKTIVKMYRNHLEQVLIILMDNAVKYSQERKEVHMTISKNSRYVEIVVQDFGEGISQDNLDKVFNRFYRVDKARSRDKGGNGLGLSIARRLIEGYHGKLSVESVIGQGSVFRISLPLSSEQEESQTIKDTEKN